MKSPLNEDFGRHKGVVKEKKSAVLESRGYWTETPQRVVVALLWDNLHPFIYSGDKAEYCDAFNGLLYAVK